MISFVCDECKNGHHCNQDPTWCDCQHRKVETDELEPGMDPSGQR